MILSLEDLDPNKMYSYADYLTWQFEERIELLKGYFRQMAAPNTKHQRVSKRMMNIFENHFQSEKCEAFYAPFDVRLYNRKKSTLADKDVFTVVQPDICVVCDASKIDERGCNGAPEMIIEILSPSNKQTDLKDKYLLYAESGVTEYWIVYPQEEVVHQYVLKEEKYEQHGVYVKSDNIKPFLFPDLTVSLEKVFYHESN
jgi:Uma2 family endonuclease